MFQKEVALRIAAAPGSADYGRLSVLCQWRCKCKKLFDVNRSAFTPPPKITSSIVQLVPRLTPEVACEISALEKVTAAAFGQRRKMLRSSLKSVFARPEACCEELGIDPTQRAEELSVNDFARLALALLRQSSFVSSRTNSVSPSCRRRRRRSAVRMAMTCWWLFPHHH